MKSLTDARGNTTTFNYNESKGTLNSTTDANNTTTSYTYNANNDQLEKVQSGNTFNRYVYDKDRLSEIWHNDDQVKYSFVYDQFGQTQNVRVGNANDYRTLSTNNYNSRGLLTNFLYGNGHNINYSYYNLDRTNAKWFTDYNKRVEYAYNADGQLGLEKDFGNNSRTRYTYDLSGRLVEYNTRKNYSDDCGELYQGKSYQYEDKTNRLLSHTLELPNTKLKTGFNYGNKAQGQMPDSVYGVKINDTQKLGYSYDGLGRLTQKAILKADGGTTNNLLTTNYNFTTGQNIKQSDYNAVLATGRVVSGDFNGDGKDDLASLYDSGGTQSKINVWLSDGKEYVYQGDNGWYNSSGYSAAKVSDRMVAGDFNGDGKDDIAAMYDYGSSRCAIHVWISSGTSFEYQTWYNNTAYNADSISGRMVAGDFNGDGKDDIAAMYDYGSNHSAIHVLISSGTSFQYQSWYNNTAYAADRASSRMVAGDFNGDGKDDIAAMYDYGSAHCAIHVLISSGTSFEYQTWHNNLSYAATSVSGRMVAGDFNGDGKDDIAAMYNYGSAHSTMHVWVSSGTSFAYQSWDYNDIRVYESSIVTNRLVAGDFNADGKDDILGLEAIGSNSANISGWLSTGSSLNLNNELWNSYKQKTTSGNSSTTLLQSITNGISSISYTYDNVGNITSISENGLQKESYTYDSLNQLTRVNSVTENKTITYAYDNGGNLLAKTEYAYTTEDLGTAIKTISYGYSDSTWKDLLTNYNNQTITYDTIGNPLQYRDGMTMTWQNGRQLATLQKGSDMLSYKHNMDGVRTEKNYNGTITSYTLDGNKIVEETKDGKTTLYYFDENGTRFGFNYSGEDYYYIFNGQSDVIGIVDSTGTQVVNYTYDSWGKVLSITGSLASTIGEINPIRYRGYYYDSDSGLYYLQSRYYDAETCRMINADDTQMLFEEQDNLLQYNLFAYCLNNPVNMHDPDGHAAANIIGGIIGGVAGAALGILLAKQLGLTGWKKWALISAATVGGAVLGAILGPYIARLAKSMGSAIKTAAKVGKELCFVAGTPVKTDKGNVPIEQVKAGDYAYAENPETGEMGLKRVLQTFENEISELVHVSANGEEIVTTPGHPFYVSEKGWVGADELKAGDLLVLYGGKQVAVKKVVLEHLSTPVKVYNFEVEDFHTYYVGSSSILVHNKGCGLNKLADSYLKKTL